MAGIDKINEFYTCALRFAFLAEAYRPDDLPEKVTDALEVLIKFCARDKKFKKRAEMAEEYFNEIDRLLK